MSREASAVALDEVDLLTQVRDAVLGVSGVAAMHAGALGEVATYLPGDRLGGIRRAGDVVEIHIATVLGSPVYKVADAVRDKAQPMLGCLVDVIVEDIIEADTNK